MRRISSYHLLLWAIFVWLFVSHSYAGMPTSYRQPHPLNWAHATPVGEMPGWTGQAWMFFEAGNANVWNAPLLMEDKRTGQLYEYEADFEQASAILEFGAALSDSIAISLEVPYAYRGGGFLDGFIDGFHVFIGNRRFNRQLYAEDQAIYSTKTDGLRYYDTEKHPLKGVSNLKPKLKWWIWKNEGRSKESCPCGLAVSAQVKIPTQDEKFGGTTGTPDYSALLHLGIPFGESSAMWFTGGYTRLGKDPAMKDWPLLRDHQMYELSFDLGINREWGILFQARMQSPYLDQKHLTFKHTSSDPKEIAQDRAASGWNALVHWQGTQAAGVRYRVGMTAQFNFLLAEDFGFGNYDADDGVYSNNAPDFNTILQTSFSW